MASQSRRSLTLGILAFAASPGVARSQDHEQDRSQDAGRPRADSTEDVERLAKDDGVAEIALRPGRFETLRIDGRTRPLRLFANDPSDPPILAQLSASDCEGLTVEGLRLGGGGSDALVRLRNCRRLTLSRLRLEDGPHGEGQRVAQGLDAADIDGLTVADCTFQGLDGGASLNRCRRIDVSHNAFRRITGHVVFGSDLEDATIARNRFGDFADGAGSRAAAFMEIRVDEGRRPCRALQIEGNVLLQETSDVVPGILLRNEVGAACEDVRIVGNLVLTGSPEAITVERAARMVVENNIVIETVKSPYNGAIRVRRSAAGSFSHNLASAFALQESSGIQMLRNVTLPRRQDVIRRRLNERVTQALAAREPRPLFGGFMVNAAHVASGPRPG